jgi:extracellular elastinolytic metalloproteinase
MNPLHRRRVLRRRVAIAATVAALIVSIVPVLPATAGPAAGPRPSRELAAHRPDGLFDIRADGSVAGVGVRVADARFALAERLGSMGVIESDRVTGTLRFLGQLDGYLTGPSDRLAADVALGFVRTNLAAFGLSNADLRTLSLRRDYVDIVGTHHLSWIQRSRGIPVFGAGLKASVANDGRLINVSGSPVHRLRPNTTLPRVGSTSAIVAARSSARTQATAATRRDSATLVLFPTGRGARLAWQTTTFVDNDQIDLSVVDAGTGEVLWRSNVVRSDVPGTASAWALTASDGVPNGGGIAAPVTFPVANGTRLAGNNAHAWADINDDDRASPGEEVPALTGVDWSGYVAPLDTTNSAQNCTTLRPCTWDRATSFSWTGNLAHNVLQLYYFANVFHDHLLDEPIGFTEAAGNFQLVNSSGEGEEGDPLRAQAMDGADAGNGLPDQAHVNNANMATLPDGTPPIMQMYLFQEAQGAPLPSANGGDDAEIVYHEYTHGLSNRLVTFPGGVGAVNSPQAAAMGEGWSDWYATDFLNAQGYKPDAPGDGNLVMGFYTFAGIVRSQPIDCPVATSATGCAGTSTAGPGGYTFGDFGDVAGLPEVHFDGEIWLETLWELRNALGSEATQGLVTRAMELSPPEPSFLDMRNSILQADLVANAGTNQGVIWQVFADRGMGYFAAALDGFDVRPVEDFTPPPDCSVDPCGTIKGRVTNKLTGAPIAGAAVRVAGLASGLANDLGDSTDGSGRYTIRNVPVHDAYGAISMDKAGFERRTVRNVTVDGTETLDGTLNRDWAAIEVGAKFIKSSPPDYSAFGCMPQAAFDLSLLTGWGSDAPKSTFGSTFTGPRKIVVRLPRAVRITTFGVASGGTCGDPDGAGVKRFLIQTRLSGGGWTTVVTDSAKNDGRLHTFVMAANGPEKARFVRFVMQSNHGNSLFMDLLELTVRGR